VVSGKKRTKPQAKPAAKKPDDKPVAKLEGGWESVIGEALKKRQDKALWPDPVGAEKWKPGSTKKPK
jgi:hypothetical protein